MPEPKPDWLTEALDSVADINAYEWPDMDPANIEWPVLTWEDEDDAQA